MSEVSDPEAPQPRPPRKRKPAEPTRRELMQQAAARGDIDGILAVLENNPFAGADHADAMREIRNALDNIGQRDPKRLVETLHTRMLVFQGAMMLRIQNYIDGVIATSDKKYPGLADVPQEIADTWLPRLSRIQDGVRESSRSLSAALHAFALADAGPIKERANSPKVIRMADAEKKLKRERKAVGDER